jgi:hypothetical protein
VIFGLGNLVTPAVAEAAESSRAEARAVGLRYSLTVSLVLIPYLAILLISFDLIRGVVPNGASL